LDDSAALSGLSEVKAIYDVRTADEKSLQFIFKVISDTKAQTEAQNVDAHYVAAMRGPTVKLLVKARHGDAELQKKTEDLIAKLTKQGIRLEACGYALNLFGVEPEDLYPGIVAVGNSLNSVIGYQSKGYALVPMN
jgi:intracellular sulfur oxidation DsrE/DsrF family protein